MKPAAILLGAPVDAVLCDCGNEIRELYTLELPLHCDYAIVRGMLAAHKFAHNAFAALDFGDEVRFVASLEARLIKVDRPFRASAACVACMALMTYEFTPEGNLLAGTKTLPPCHVEF